MKTKIFLTVALVLTLLVTIYGVDYEKTYIGKGRMPMFVSSDSIAYLNDQGNLVFADFNGNIIKDLGKISDHALRIEWLGDCFVYLTQEVTFEGRKRKVTKRLLSIDLEGHEEVIEETDGTKGLTVPIHLPDGTVGYQKEHDGRTYFNVIKEGVSDSVTNQWILDIKIEEGNHGSIWTRKVDGSDSQRITQDYYTLPRIYPDGSQLSPDGEKILAIQMRDGRPVVIDIATKEKTILGDSIVVLGQNVKVDSIEYATVTGGTVGYLSRWSPSGKITSIYQKACMGYSGDMEISDICASDIQVFNTDGTLEAFIVTDDIKEFDAVMSKDGAILAETEDGRIYLFRRGEGK